MPYRAQNQKNKIMAKTAAKPAAKTAAKPAAKTAAKPAAKTEAKPAAKTEAKITTFANIRDVKKVYPKMSDDDCKILVNNPEAIIPSMFDTSEEFQEARLKQHHDNHDNYFESRK